MKISSFKKKHWIFLIIAVLVFAAAPFVWGIQFYNQYRTNSSETTPVVDATSAHSAWNVINDSQIDYLIPNRTENEWTSFVNNLPQYVYLESVEIPCESTTLFTCGNSCTYLGATYDTVLIGSKCWFADDLKATKRPDGSSIPQWALGTGQYNAVGCADVSDAYYYGGYYTCASTSCTSILYQYDAAFIINSSRGRSARGICPSGWHIVNTTDLQSLRTTTNSTCPSSNYLDQWDYACLNTNFGLSIVPYGFRNPAMEYLGSYYSYANVFHPAGYFNNFTSCYGSCWYGDSYYLNINNLTGTSGYDDYSSDSWETTGFSPYFVDRQSYPESEITLPTTGRGPYASKRCSAKSVRCVQD